MTDDRMASLVTTLRNEFRKRAVRMEARGRVMDASVTGFSERLRVFEERVSTMLKRRSRCHA